MTLKCVLKLGNHGKIVAINIETGTFEIADPPMQAVDRLYEREPNAQPWVIRIGHRAVFRFGSRSRTADRSNTTEQKPSLPKPSPKKGARLIKILQAQFCHGPSRFRFGHVRHAM
jgi:hypothetical protein